MKFGHIGHGRSLSLQMRRYFDKPVAIVRPPKLSEEDANKMLKQLRDSTGRAMLIIDPPEVEMIPYRNPKKSRLKQYRQFPGKNKKNVRIQCQ